MARTPSKITKRDIDKNLYLEIVNEASNEANVQQLLEDYVRKDEGISEWQIPTKYRQNLSKRLNDLDTGIQDIKNDKTQQTWNEDILKRVQTLEKKEGLAPDKDGNISPIIGTQVAANTSGISENTKQITVLQGKVETLEHKHDDDKLALQAADQKIENDLKNQLKTASDRMSTIETKIVGKRDRSELIKEDDLDESVKKNIRAVLNIGDTTIDALDNLDGVIKRIDAAEQTASMSSAAVSDMSSSIASMKSTIESGITEQIAEVRTTEQNDFNRLQSDLNEYMSSNDAKMTSMSDQVAAMNTLVTAKDYRIDTINDKVENVAVDAKNNAINIAGVEDRIEELGASMNIQKQSFDATYKLMANTVQNAQKYPQIAKGKLLLVGDSDGGLVGTNLVFESYAAYGNNALKEYLEERYSPIYDLGNDRVFIDLSTEVTEAKDEKDAGNETPANEPTAPAESAGSNAESGTDGEPSQGSSTPASDEAKESSAPADDVETTKLNIGDAAGNETGDAAALEASLAENDAAEDSKVADAMSDLAGSSAGEAAGEPAKQPEPAPSQEGAEKTADGSSNEKTGDESKTDDQKVETPKDEGSKDATPDSDKADDNTKTDNPEKDTSAEEEEAEILALAKNYQIVNNFAAAPENFNTFLFDRYHHSLFGYIDGIGEVHGFGTYSASDDPIEISMPAGGCASFYRNSASSKPPVNVLIRDQDGESLSFGRWINSEGVITVAYDDDMYSVFNNSGKEQQVRIIGG